MQSNPSYALQRLGQAAGTVHMVASLAAARRGAAQLPPPSPLQYDDYPSGIFSEFSSSCNSYRSCSSCRSWISSSLMGFLQVLEFKQPKVLVPPLVAFLWQQTEVALNTLNILRLMKDNKEEEATDEQA
ncbi:hypothetical protein MTO96_026926 [Rhipicephalus appendiculatus]